MPSDGSRGGDGPTASLERPRIRIDIAYSELEDLPPRDQVDPIAALPSQRHMFTVWRGGPYADGGHPVLWFDGELAETWPNV